MCSERKQNKTKKNTERKKKKRLVGFYFLSSLAEIDCENKFDGERLNFNLQTSIG